MADEHNTAKHDSAKGSRVEIETIINNGGTIAIFQADNSTINLSER